MSLRSSQVCIESRLVKQYVFKKLSGVYIELTSQTIGNSSVSYFVEANIKLGQNTSMIIVFLGSLFYLLVLIPFCS